MSQLDLNFIYQTFGHTLSINNSLVNRIVIDSRQVQPGDVFIALKGEHHDGHDYIDDVIKKGASLCLVSRIDCKGKARCLPVPDTEQALGTLAKTWRLAVNPQLKVFGITGSCGKTTVKEMLASILRTAVGSESVLATEGNFNNHIGLPLTLLKLREQHQFAVIEMGMSHFGELTYLTQLACPDFALVNNALRAHVGCGFNGVQDIAKAKSEIYQGLNQNGLGFIPAEDSQRSIFIDALKGKHSYYFGVDSGEFHAEQIILHPFSTEFTLCSPEQKITVNMPVPGRHMIHNAIGASAVALSVGIKAKYIREGLAHFSNIKGRLQQKKSRNGALIIDDTYNANTDAYRAAIDVLAALPAPRILVMGAIGELGSDSFELHAEVGAYAQSRGIENAYFIGDDSVYAAEAYGSPETFFKNKSDLIKTLQILDNSEASFLIKGSRFMKMEEVVNALVGE